ncbi:MAG: 30S ribosomal protein S14 [Candidatus Woesearchaeota archaeon]|nr:30S ribosomal protein S14 [Candidatus Woesearchaeota archaeon]MDP7457953.1 30S ribosomal protein S14 [Candidatus Woesearchaeota archaeon]
MKAKPVKLAKYKKHNAPKERKTGRNNIICVRCGRRRGIIRKYGLYVCRQCFREIALKIGFKKFS